MGLGNLLRGAAEYADKATAAVSEAAGDAMSMAKAKADSLRGDDAGVYEQALIDAEKAIANHNSLTPEISGTFMALREGNPFK